MANPHQPKLRQRSAAQQAQFRRRHLVGLVAQMAHINAETLPVTCTDDLRAIKAASARIMDHLYAEASQRLCQTASGTIRFPVWKLTGWQQESNALCVHAYLPGLWYGLCQTAPPEKDVRRGTLEDQPALTALERNLCPGCLAAALHAGILRGQSERHVLRRGVREVSPEEVNTHLLDYRDRAAHFAELLAGTQDPVRSDYLAGVYHDALRQFHKGERPFDAAVL